MSSLIYTHQKSKLSKKQRAAREALLKEQREIKRSLTSKTYEPLSLKFSTPAGRETAQIRSVGDGIGNATIGAPKMYTGDKMIGIGQLHKSNAVPVFRQEDAEDLARMRR